MRLLGIAIPAGEVLAAGPGESRGLAARAAERGLDSLWVLAADREGSMALPLTAAAMGSALPGLRLGIGLIAYDDPVRMAEDLSVLDNVLGGRLAVAFARRRQPGGSPARAELARLKILCDLLRGEPVDLGADRGRVQVFPRAVQRPLAPAVYLTEDDSLHDDVYPVLRAGFAVVLPHRLALALPATWRSGRQVQVTETVASPAELDEPVPPGVSARLLLASLRQPEAVDEVAARLAPAPGRCSVGASGVGEDGGP